MRIDVRILKQFVVHQVTISNKKGFFFFLDVKRVSATTGCVKRARLDLVGSSSGFVEVNAAHQRKVVWYYFKNQTNLFNYQQFLSIVKPILTEKLTNFAKIRPIKFNLKLETTYRIPNVENSSENRAFKSSARTVSAYSNVNNIVEDAFAVLMSEQDSYAGKGSGFTLDRIDGCF